MVAIMFKQLAFLDVCIKAAHDTMFEHIALNVSIHRIGKTNVNQVSANYCNSSNVQPAIAKQDIDRMLSDGHAEPGLGYDSEGHVSAVPAVARVGDAEETSAGVCKHYSTANASEQPEEPLKITGAARKTCTTKYEGNVSSTGASTDGPTYYQSKRGKHNC